MTAIPITRVVKVFAAGDSTFVIRRGGAVWAWGRFSLSPAADWQTRALS